MATVAENIVFNIQVAFVNTTFVRATLRRKLWTEFENTTTVYILSFNIQQLSYYVF